MAEGQGWESLLSSLNGMNSPMSGGLSERIPDLQRDPSRLQFSPPPAAPLPSGPQPLWTAASPQTGPVSSGLPFGMAFHPPGLQSMVAPGLQWAPGQQGEQGQPQGRRRMRANRPEVGRQGVRGGGGMGGGGFGAHMFMGGFPGQGLPMMQPNMLPPQMMSQFMPQLMGWG